MSPFSSLLHDLRKRFNISQKTLGELTGYEQGYVSALELGVKGPPTSEFLQKLISALSLSEEDACRIRDAVETSRYKILIRKDAPESIFLMCNELRQQLDHLHPGQIEAIRAVLRLSPSLKEPEPSVDHRFCHQKTDPRREEAAM